MPGWVPTGTLSLNDIGRVRLALASPLPDRPLPRAPGDRCLHHRRRGRRLDARRRHGRLDVPRLGAGAQPQPRPPPRKEGCDVCTLPHPARLRQPRPRRRPGQPPDPQPDCSTSGPSWTSTSPSWIPCDVSASGPPTRHRAAGHRQAGQGAGSPRSSWSRCCCPTPSTRTPSCRPCWPRPRPTYPELRLTVSRPIGPEAQLLSRHRPAAARCPAGPTGLRAGRPGLRRGRQQRHPQQRHRGPPGPAVGRPTTGCRASPRTRPGPDPTAAEAIRTLRVAGSPPHRRRQLVPRPRAALHPAGRAGLRGRRRRRLRTRWAASRRSPRSPSAATSSRPWTWSTWTDPRWTSSRAPMRHLSVVGA